MDGILVFQLKAPLASFGSSPGSYRQSDSRPRRSALLGVVAAALGIEHKDSESFQQLIQSVRVAHLALGKTEMMVDYHTVEASNAMQSQTRREQLHGIQEGPNDSPWTNEDRKGLGKYDRTTVVTKREYLQSGHWLVALQADEQLLRRIERALEQPTYPLFLGRKCCPLSEFPAPMLFSGDAGLKVEAALRIWAQAWKVTMPRQETSLFWDEGMAVETRPLASHTRKDVRTSLRHNFFSQRQELEGALTLAESNSL